MLWDENRQHEILLSEEDLPELKNIIQKLIDDLYNQNLKIILLQNPRKRFGRFMNIMQLFMD